MTSRSPLDDHFGDFGRALHRAGAPRRAASTPRRWVRPAVGLGGLATIGVGALALTVFPGGPGRIDIVSEAQAALADPGSILHLVVSSSSAQVDGGPGRPVPAADRHKMLRERACADTERPVSLWAAMTGPSRYRVARNNYRCSATVEFRRVIAPGAKAEIGYSGGVLRSYYPDQNLLLRQTELLPADRNMTEFSPAQLGMQDGLTGDSEPVRDPLDRIRALLNEGKLRDAGRFTGADGRALWRLTAGVSRSEEFKDKDGQESTLKISSDYVVDAKTFAPVSFTNTARTSVQGKPGPAYANTVRFLTYERLPLNAETEKLLEIQPAEGTETLTMTSRQIRKLYRGPTRGAAEDKAAYKAARAVADRNMEEAKAEVEAQIRSEQRTGDVAPTTP